MKSLLGKGGTTSSKSVRGEFDGTRKSVVPLNQRPGKRGIATSPLAYRLVCLPVWASDCSTSSGAMIFSSPAIRSRILSMTSEEKLEHPCSFKSRLLAGVVGGLT